MNAFMTNNNDDICIKSHLNATIEDLLEKEENEEDISDDTDELIISDEDTDEMFKSDDSYDDNNNNELHITDIDDDIIDIDEFLKKQKCIIKNVSKILNLTEDIAFLLLKKFNFNSNSLFEYWTKENDAQKKLQALINIPIEMIDKPLIIQKMGI